MNNYIIKYAGNKKMLRFRIPQNLWEACRERVNEFGFRSNTEVLTHLAVCLWMQKNELSIPKAAENILLCIPESCQHRPYQRNGFTIQRACWMKKEDAMRLLSLYSSNMSILFNELIEAFLTADEPFIRGFRKVVHAGYICQPVASRIINTYVTNDQYDYIREMARNAGLKITQLFRLVLDVFTQNEESHCVPEPVSSVFRAVMSIDGVTLKNFKREVAVHLILSDNNQRDTVKAFMKRYKIPGARELLRRLVLFLLYSRELSGSFLPGIPEEESRPEICWDEMFDENESYWNTRMARREFAGSLYK